MGSRLRVLAQALQVIALLAIAAPALAQSPEPPSRQQFQKGVELYQQGDFRGAADAFEASYMSDPVVDTLFAWAQAERKAGNCEKAIELFDKLLIEGVTSENADAVKESRARCVEALEAARAETSTENIHSTTTKTDSTTDTTTSTDTADTTTDTTPVAGGGQPPAEGRPWYKDPVGGSLLAGGVVGLGVGLTFFALASNADSAKDNADNYFDFVDNRDKAESRARIAWVTIGVGVVFLGSGIAWYVLRGDDEERPADVSAWADPRGGGGLVVSGRF